MPLKFWKPNEHIWAHISCYQAYHRVDSVMESSSLEIIGSQNFALINLSLNFCETTIYENEVFLENLVAVQ